MNKDLSQLVGLLRSYIKEERIYEINHLLDEFEQASLSDNITGFFTRYSFASQLEEILIANAEQGMRIALMLIDLDRFRLVNETYGHILGDEIIAMASQRIRECFDQHIPNSGLLGRVGDDEFAAALLGDNAQEDAMRFSDTIHKAFQSPFIISKQNIFITCSIGVAVLPIENISASALFRNADGAMYIAKRQGRNITRLYSEGQNYLAQQDTHIENELRSAVEKRELYLLYQPLVSTHTGEIAGVEALVRWQHPELGAIPPARFIPIAERSDLVVEIGHWILEDAMQQILRWHADDHQLFLAVNVSAIQFRHAEFASNLEFLLNKTGLRPSWLEIELTERIMMQQSSMGLDTLRTLRNLGVGVAIDDFGTGFSSLSYLQQLPIDSLKIDQSFVFGIGEDALVTAKSKAIIKAIGSLAHELGLSVVAEGVETSQQLDFLMNVQSDFLQGYFFGRPLQASEAETLFGKRLIPQQ